MIRLERQVSITRPRPNVVLDHPKHTVAVMPARGPRGDDGTSGSNFEATAAITLSGHRLVKATNSGVTYLSNTQPSSASVDVWLTINAADAGTKVALHTFGRITNPSWSWTLGQPVWLGVNGVLTQTSPSIGVLRQVASVIDAITLFYNPRPALVLA